QPDHRRPHGGARVLRPRDRHRTLRLAHGPGRRRRRLVPGVRPVQARGHPRADPRPGAGRPGARARRRPGRRHGPGHPRRGAGRHGAVAAPAAARKAGRRRAPQNEQEGNEQEDRTMKQNFYEPDHESFREVVAAFVEREVLPNLDRWDEQRLIDRETWLVAGRQGIIGLSAPEEFGGPASPDYRFRMVVLEELGKAFATSLASSFSLQDDILIPYISAFGTDEQRRRWLPPMISGELIAAIAMTEPGTGSDLQGIRTSAVRVDGGWRVNGAKTFITSGIQCDLVVVVARTDPEGGPHGFTLLVVEKDMPGFTRGRKLDKVGLDAQDTAELFFEDVFVPEANVLGEVGGGMAQLKQMLPLERLSIAAHAVAVSEAVLANTVE